MSRHDRTEAQLLGPKGGRFVANAIRALTGQPLPAGASVVGIAEYPYRATEIPVGHMTDSMRLDVLFVILMPEDRITLAVEVKTSRDDLLFDTKLCYELVADYLFLAVPRKMIPAALFFIRNQAPECVCRIGLLDLDDGDIVVQPERSARILGMEDVLVNAILRGTHVEISRGTPKAEFVRRNDLLINTRYAGMLSVRYTPRLPRPGQCFERFRHSPLFLQLLDEKTRAGPSLFATAPLRNTV